MSPTLDLLLAKAVIGCNLRDCLVKYNIAANETVVIKISHNNAIIATAEVPTKDPELFTGNITLAQESNMERLREEIAHFMNQADAVVGLLAALPTSAGASTDPEQPDTKIYGITFDIGSVTFKNDNDNVVPPTIKPLEQRAFFIRLVYPWNVFPCCALP